MKNDILKAMNQGSIVKGEDGKIRIKVKKSGGMTRTAKEAGISENKDPNNLKKGGDNMKSDGGSLKSNSVTTAN